MQRKMILLALGWMEGVFCWRLPAEAVLPQRALKARDPKPHPAVCRNVRREGVLIA